MSGGRDRDERTVHPEFAERAVEPVLAALSAIAPRYTVVRRLPHGAWGAWLVRSRRGSYAVLKRVWDTDWRGRLASAAAVVDALAARGAAVPRYLASGYAEAVGTWCLQEHLPGERVRRLTPRSHRAVATGRRDTSAPAMTGAWHQPCPNPPC